MIPRAVLKKDQGRFVRLFVCFLVQELLRNDSIRSGDLSLRGGEEGETWKKGADEAREERVGHFLTFL